MAQSPQNQELTERFIQFYRNYYRDEIGRLAQRYPNEQRSLYVDYNDLYTFDPDLARDFLNKPEQIREYAEEALRLFDLPADVKLGQAHVRLHSIDRGVDIRNIRVHDDHVGQLIAVQGIVRKATDVRPKITEAAFECQRCGTMTYIPQSDGSFQEPHECQGCERQGPFRVNFDQSEFVDSQKLRVQESPEGLRGGETPQNIDVNVEDDITGKVTAGDHVTVTGVLHIEQMKQGNEKTPIFDLYMDGVSITIEDEEFEDMDITDEDKAQIVELSNEPDVYEQMVGSIAPSIYGYDQEKLAMLLQLFSGVTKHLPDESRIRGDLHMLLIGDPGTGKSQLLSYIQHIAPRSVYTSGKGSSSAGLTAAAVRDDFGDGQQWTLEAGALVLADKGIAAVDELDKMRCVTGETLIHLDDSVTRIRDFAHDAARDGEIESLPNGRTIRDVDAEAWTMTEDGRLVTRSVTAVHEYDAPEALVEVTLESGESLTSTADHPFFVFANGDRIEKPAAELEADEWVYVPRRLTDSLADGGVEAISESSGTDTADFDSSCGVSPSLGAILGYLAGDGNLYYDRSEGVYGIRFTNKEEQLLADFEEACVDAFGVEPTRPPSERRNDGVTTVRVIGKEAADRVLAAGMNLETYDGKRLPEAVSKSSRAAKAAFLRALADSEASVDRSNVKIYSASYELLLGAKQLLLEFGVSTQIQTRERDEKRDLHVLAITDADSLVSYEQYIGFTLDRKQQALEEAVGNVSGNRTILDVIPGVGNTLATLRSSLRLHQSECGVGATTYCDFENGDANVSIRAARDILDAFDARVREAATDVDGIHNASWGELERLQMTYHVSQAELAASTQYSQQNISRLWGQDDDLREVVITRLRNVITEVTNTDLSPLRELVYADVKWRRVTSVRRVSANVGDSRIELLENALADLFGCDSDEAIDTARTVLGEEPDLSNWSGVREALDSHEISMTTLADDLGVHQSTMSRWFNGAVETDRFPDVVTAASQQVETVRSEAQALLDEIEARKQPNVYDITVDGTHNFVANGLVVHNSEDRSAMHEALEQQKISIAKAGINATLKSRCSLLGAANPKYGRFDQYEPIGEQIDLEPALISRFDLIFTVTDQPDPEHDANLADHILKTNYAGELNTQRERMETSNFTREEVESVTDEVAPVIDPDLMRKYIAFSKRNCFPTMTDEAREAIREFYVDLRAKGTDKDAPVPVTARKLEALVRLSEASARVRLSDTVEPEDAERVIEIVRSCLQDIGVDPETGKFDADVVETGTSKSQRDRIKNLKQLIADIEDEYEEGAPVEEILSRADEIGLDRSKAEDEIEKLRRKGEVYEPRQDHLRTT
ncbi:MAG: LAGLIDADG family homing endonuclease [Haloferacaceae archaeon]